MMEDRTVDGARHLFLRSVRIPATLKVAHASVAIFSSRLPHTGGFSNTYDHLVGRKSACSGVLRLRGHLYHLSYMYDICLFGGSALVFTLYIIG